MDDKTLARQTAEKCWDVLNTSGIDDSGKFHSEVDRWEVLIQEALSTRPAPERHNEVWEALEADEILAAHPLYAGATAGDWHTQKRDVWAGDQLVCESIYPVVVPEEGTKQEQEANIALLCDAKKNAASLYRLQSKISILIEYFHACEWHKEKNDRVSPATGCHKYECGEWRLGKKYKPCTCGASKTAERIEKSRIAVIEALAEQAAPVATEKGNG